MTSISNVNAEIEAINTLIIKFGALWSFVIMIILIIIWFMFQRMKTQVIEEVKTEHQKLLNQEDRKGNLKRDIYLELSQAINRTCRPLLFMSDYSIPDKDLFSDSLLISDIIAKSQLILPIDVLKNLNEFNKITSEEIQHLIIKRLELNILKNDIDTYQKLYDESSEQRSKYLELMKEHTISGNTDNARYESLQNWNNHFNKASDEYALLKGQLWKELISQQLYLAQEALSSYKKVSKAIPNITCSIRKELEFNIKLEEYSKLFQEFNESSLGIMSNTIKELKKLDKKLDSN